MRQGIVIACTEKHRPFYEDMVKTLKTKYPVVFSWEGVDRPEQSHEYGAVRVGKEHFDEFILLHCTMLIKDNSIFEKLFAMEGTVALTHWFFHLMGKYVSKDISPIPDVHSKAESIANEIHWFKNPYTVFEPELPVESALFEERHGRKNMVLENPYLIKFKGHWGQPYTE